MIHLFNHSNWYAVVVFLPVLILLMAVSVIVYIYFFTSCTLTDFYSKPSDPSEDQNFLDSQNDGRSWAMSRFLTQAELQKVFVLPEYMPRNLDLTLKERKFLSRASKVYCAKSDQRDQGDYLNYIDTDKFTH